MAKKDSIYKGELVSSDGTKGTTDFQGITIHIDRPRGLRMFGIDPEGKEWERKYKYDYGFIPKTLGGDGDGLDVFIGPDKKAQEAYWAVQIKPDGSFDEYKCFLGFTSREAAIGAYRDHVPVKLLKGMVTMRLDMMKAMLGKDPTGAFAKTAMQWVSFQDELNKLASGSGLLEIRDKVKHMASKVSRKAIVDDFTSSVQDVLRRGVT